MSAFETWRYHGISKKPSRNIFLGIIDGFINRNKAHGRLRRMWISDVRIRSNIKEYSVMKRIADNGDNDGP